MEQTIYLMFQQMKKTMNEAPLFSYPSVNEIIPFERERDFRDIWQQNTLMDSLLYKNNIIVVF